MRLMSVILIFGSMSTMAAVSPVSIAIVPPIQFPPDSFNVAGLRASIIWGKHRSVYGLDIGAIGNITEQDFTGIGISGIFNYTKGTTTILGAQIAGIGNVNMNKTRVFGVQVGLIGNYQTAESFVAGIQVASIANICPHTSIYGLQVGLYNKALAVYGFQIGLVNSATNVHGLQIGLINFHEKGLFVVSPILNFGF